ncbi:inositol polyphosphate 5-phosphatase [Skeletonema marinoi]|uniref:Inositol polyphosphate 5-phosphatase n=1 Tax=Skeletonema marinoi TaxID=267567 RepID=A0AAD9D6E0_9STRA|nr:inositol polyphosphate 5-phosphatase [Skeletonema marinoi]
MTAGNFISLLYTRALAIVFTCTVSDLMNVNPYTMDNNWMNAPGGSNNSAANNRWAAPAGNDQQPTNNYVPNYGNPSQMINQNYGAPHSINNHHLNGSRHRHLDRSRTLAAHRTARQPLLRQHHTSQKAPTDPIIADRAGDEETEDGRIRNKEAASKIRDAWIYKQIRARQDEFTTYQQGRIFVGTWNVNAKGKDENLSSWLCADWHQYGPPDIVVVGFQEMVDLNAVNVAVENKSQQRSQFWVDRIRSTLNSRENTMGDPMRAYTQLAVKYLVGLLVCVFVKAPHKPRLKYVGTDSVGVGVMGVMGNKGGVSIRLQFYDTTLCFVCTHLAAHRENVAGRNADFANVLVRHRSKLVKRQSVSKANQLSELIEQDQLNVERAQGRVFQDWEEGQLAFKPTYKYQPGTDLYEERPDKSCEPGHVSQLNYVRSEINFSDHKPVMSTFLVTIKDVVLSKRMQVYKEVIRLLDTFENNSLPMVSLDRIKLDFGEVRYDQRVTLPIIITNTGKVVAPFRLVPKLEEEALCKPWVTVSPAYGMLIPGEQTRLKMAETTTFQLAVNMPDRASECPLTTLFFTLTHRAVPLDPILRAEKYDINTKAAMCVPKELWRIIDAIYERGWMKGIVLYTRESR